MSDFISNFWHLYVAGITLVAIIACLILLWFIAANCFITRFSMHWQGRRRSSCGLCKAASGHGSAAPILARVFMKMACVQANWWLKL